MSGGGTQRSNIFPGQTVAIVLKSDQQSGILTHGTVQALLTNSEVSRNGPYLCCAMLFFLCEPHRSPHIL